MNEVNSTTADGPSDIAANPPFPLGVMIFAVIAVFLMPVIILVYAARTASHHAQQNLPAAALQAIEQGRATEVPLVTLPLSPQNAPRP